MKPARRRPARRPGRGPQSIGAGAPLHRIVRALRGAYWGDDLAGRPWHGLRAVLLALVDVADHKGRATATTFQLAGRAGYGLRWTRWCLQALEYAGIVTWYRGGLEVGAARALPSLFLIDRHALVALIPAARDRKTEAERQHRAALVERLQRFRNARLGRVNAPEPRYPRSDHAALSADLPPSRGRPQGTRPPRQTPEDPMTLRDALDAVEMPKTRKETAAPPPGPDDKGVDPDVVVDLAAPDPKPANPALEDIRATIAAAVEKART